MIRELARGIGAAIVTVLGIMFLTIAFIVNAICQIFRR